MKITKLGFYNFISYLFLAVLTVIAYWMVFPYKPIVFNTDPLVVNKKTVASGEHIVIELDYCKNMDLSAEMDTSFIDGVIYHVAPAISNMPTGCHKKQWSLYVPKALPAGEMKIKTIFKYKVNPLRTVDVEVMSESFVIVK